MLKKKKMYVRAALLALALGHASAATNDEEANYDKFAVLRAPPNEDKFAVLRALDDSQLMAEVARRNLNRAARCRARCS